MTEATEHSCMNINTSQVFVSELWILKPQSSLGKHTSLVEHLKLLLHFISEYCLPHDLLLWTYSRTPLQKSRTQNGNAEFQVKMGHQQPGAPSNAAMLAASVMARSTSPKKICLGPLEGFLKKRRQVRPFSLRKIAKYRNELRVRVDIKHQSSTFKAGTAAAREQISGEFRPQAWSWSCPQSICEVLGKWFQLSEPQSPPSWHGTNNPHDLIDCVGFK